MGLATNFVGELLGTFALVFFGCGVVASATLFRGIFQRLLGRPALSAPAEKIVKAKTDTPSPCR